MVRSFFREAYMVVLDDDEWGRWGKSPATERSEDGFFNDARVQLTGRTVLDNGLEVGARVELEGEDKRRSGGGSMRPGCGSRRLRPVPHRIR